MSNKDCPICYCECLVNEELYECTNCTGISNIYYHKECIDNWNKNQIIKCPTCNNYDDSDGYLIPKGTNIPYNVKEKIEKNKRLKEIKREIELENTFYGIIKKILGFILLPGKYFTLEKIMQTDREQPNLSYNQRLYLTYLAPIVSIYIIINGYTILDDIHDKYSHNYLDEFNLSVTLIDNNFDYNYNNAKYCRCKLLVLMLFFNIAYFWLASHIYSLFEFTISLSVIRYWQGEISNFVKTIIIGFTIILAFLIQLSFFGKSPFMLMNTDEILKEISPNSNLVTRLI